MKRNLLLTFLFVFSFAGLFAQRVANPKSIQLANQKAMPMVKTAFTGFEEQHAQVSVPVAENAGYDLVGNTAYDLQSNGGVGHRVYNFGGGKVSATFNFSANATGGTYPDRGTGFNTRTGGTWGPEPTARVEATRTGFTNYSVSPDGTEEYVVAHLGTNKVNVAKRVNGGAWTSSVMPGAASVLWPRAALGGSNGKTLHVIASSLPTGNGGTLYQGMNGVMLYYRSEDGGATWNIQDKLMEGIDSTTFIGTDIEAYAIDANGQNVSILTTNSFNDCLLYTSDDNGTTWTKRLVNDFPLTRYVINSGYDTLDLPADPYRANLGTGGDPYGIFTADGVADLIVDEAGISHVWYGCTYVSDVDLTDAGWTFYPGTNIGIVYFNSLMNDNEGVISGYCPDINNNQVLDVTDISNYGIGLSSHPAGSIDANGNLFVTFSTVHELYLDGTSGFNFRQPFVAASQDNGATWNEPKAVLDSLLMGDDYADAPYLEAIFNTVAKTTDDLIHITFQADYAPLTYVQTPETDTEPGDNSIRYIGYPAAWALATATKNVAAETLKFALTPNPANDRLVVEFNSDRTQNSSVELYDMFGRVVRSTASVTVGAGQGTVTMTTSDLAAGMYVARLNLGNTFATKKVNIQH
jgi:hypothetical protein